MYLAGFNDYNNEEPEPNEIKNLDNEFGIDLLDKFQDIIFTNNIAENGGALYVDGAYDSTPTFTDCLFQNNTSTNFAGAIGVAVYSAQVKKFKFYFIKTTL